MLFSRFKTSTRTALIFTLFTSVLLIVFVAVLNIYYFSTWYIDEQNEVLEKIEKIEKSILKSANGSGTFMDEEMMSTFIKKIIEQGGMVETLEGETFVSPKWTKEKSDFL